VICAAVIAGKSVTNVINLDTSPGCAGKILPVAIVAMELDIYRRIAPNQLMSLAVTNVINLGIFLVIAPSRTTIPVYLATNATKAGISPVIVQTPRNPVTIAVKLVI